MSEQAGSTALIVGGVAGCLTAVLVTIGLAAVVVFGMWGAYEAGATQMGAEAAVPIGSACGLCAGLALGGVVFTLVRNTMLRRAVG